MTNVSDIVDPCVAWVAEPERNVRRVAAGDLVPLDAILWDLLAEAGRLDAGLGLSLHGVSTLGR